MGSPTSMDEKLLAFCNCLAKELGIDLNEVGAERFVSLLTDALAKSDLRIAEYVSPSWSDN